MNIYYKPVKKRQHFSRYNPFMIEYMNNVWNISLSPSNPSLYSLPPYLSFPFPVTPPSLYPSNTSLNHFSPYLSLPVPVTPPLPLPCPSSGLSVSSSSLDPQHLLIPQVYLWLEQLQMRREYRGSTSTSWLKNHSEEMISWTMIRKRKYLRFDQS